MVVGLLVAIFYRFLRRRLTRSTRTSSTSTLLPQARSPCSWPTPWSRWAPCASCGRAGRRACRCTRSSSRSARWRSSAMSSTADGSGWEGPELPLDTSLGLIVPAVGIFGASVAAGIRLKLRAPPERGGGPRLRHYPSPRAATSYPWVSAPLTPQVSATRYPSWNGSEGSTRYWWRPVIQAEAAPRRGRSLPARRCASRPTMCPSKTVPITEECDIASPGRHDRPRACRAAMRAQRPVPVGLRSSRPGATTTALRRDGADTLPGRGDLHDRDVSDRGMLGVGARQLLARGDADALPHQGEFAGLAGLDREPERGGVGDRVEHPAVGDIDARECRRPRPRAARRCGRRSTGRS